MLHHDLKLNSKQPSSIYGQQNWLKVHVTLLQHQIGREYFYCTTHWTTGYRQYSLRFAKVQTQQVTGHIYHRPHLLLFLTMAGIWRKDRSVAVSAVFLFWVGVINALETQVFWGVEERERNECPRKWALTLGWKELRGCWDGQKWPDHNHGWDGTHSCDTSPYSWPQRFPNTWGRSQLLQLEYHTAGKASCTAHAVPRVREWLEGTLTYTKKPCYGRQVRNSIKVQIFQSDDLLHHLTTAWPRQVIQGLDFLTCELGIIIWKLTSVENK